MSTGCSLIKTIGRRIKSCRYKILPPGDTIKRGMGVIFFFMSKILTGWGSRSGLGEVDRKDKATRRNPREDFNNYMISKLLEKDKEHLEFLKRRRDEYLKKKCLENYQRHVDSLDALSLPEKDSAKLTKEITIRFSSEKE